MLKSIAKYIALFCLEPGFTLRSFRHNQKGEWWLIAQLFIIFMHLIPPLLVFDRLEKYSFTSHLAICLFIVGTILCISSLSSLGRNISPLPVPKEGAKFITSRAYKRCRHPLYQALLIISFSVFIYHGSLIHLFLLISLCYVLKGKALREERMLTQIHPEYHYYKKKTPAIFPSIPWMDWRS